MILDYFSEHFHILADAPNSIQRFRELILQLGVQGKLVLQDPKEEPASMLLKKVRAEKEKLVKEGKIKKSKPLPPIDPDDVPYELPESWEWVRLGELSRIIGGGTPRTNNPAFFADTGIPWLTPADLYKLKTKTVARGKRDISELGLAHSSAQLMPAGTVLFSSRAPIGYVAIAANDLATNQGFKSCVPFIMAMNEYIYYFLMSAKEKIDQSATGTTFREISGKGLSLVLFPLPPLAEQKRIVAKVDQLIALCDELEARQKKRAEDRITLNRACLNVLTSTDEDSEQNAWQRISDNFDLLYDCPENVSKLRQAILQLAVQGMLVPQDPIDEPASVFLKKIEAEKEKLIKEGKRKKKKSLPPINPDELPFELPKGWEWAQLASTLPFDLTDGDWIESKDQDPDGDVRLIQLADVGVGEFKDKSQRFLTSNTALRLNCTYLKAGDVLIARLPDPLGRACIFPGVGQLAVTAVDVAIARTTSFGIDRQFLVHLMNSNLMRNQIESVSTGTTRKRISSGNLRKLYVPILSLAEQKRIVAKVNQFIALCDELEAKLKHTQSAAETLMGAVVSELTTA